MSGITLSPKHGLNPSMLVCPICGEPTNEIAFLGRINDKTRNADIEAPRYMIGQDPCKACQKLLDEGNKFLLEVEDMAIRGEHKRTGRYMVLRSQALPNWPHQISYCKHTDYEQFLKQANGTNEKPTEG